MTLAVICSGQGRQHSDMFAVTGEAPAASALFRYAQTLLGGVDPRRMVREASPELLHSNRYGQIVCTLQALAAIEILRPSLPSQVVFAGYSVGEVAAWGVAGVFGHSSTLDLVAGRADIMDAVSSPGDGLLFIRGLARETIDRLCAKHGAAIAIINPQEAYIVGGTRVSLQAVMQDARELQPITIALLPVMVASHTKLMSRAAVEFGRVLNATAAVFPLRSGLRLLSGVDGASVSDVRLGLAKLARQISETVNWAACLQGCVEGGATCFLELGPGDALSKMARGAFPDIPSRSVDDFRSVAGVQAWVASRS
ncbi:malonate decarboxylase subunit epsilon [Rhizobium laguerreae]|uniref:malonate decarboxylase subunit epsilon n=1 Tax=Rhizobium laguerreae TaxID=1076926 RepID=UPI001C917A48|nr:malonate decarboxylase subunit epsilon [Rhizobium laguerreae]MBY3537542.1 malonate decarboxylase subunit epsilon [Rhizobium laguerreae]